MHNSHQTALITFVLASILYPLAYAQNTPVPTPKPKQADALAHWRNATVALGIEAIKQDSSLEFIVTGSGVLVALDEHRGAILTAKHMVVDMATDAVTHRLWARLPSTDGKPTKDYEIGLFSNGKPTWRESKDGSDLAVIPIPQGFRNYQLEAVGIQDFANPDLDVYQGANVVVLGYPQIIGDAYLTSPIAREGIVAWVDPSSPSDKPFLVDANLYNGNSGGPVFHVRNGLTKEGGISLGGGYALLGIVSKGPLQNAPVVTANGYVYDKPSSPLVQPAQEYAVVANVGGIGIIEPAAKAKKLLEDTFEEVKAGTLK